MFGEKENVLQGRCSSSLINPPASLDGDLKMVPPPHFLLGCLTCGPFLVKAGVANGRFFFVSCFSGWETLSPEDIKKGYLRKTQPTLRRR